jgi:hypothetical protein
MGMQLVQRTEVGSGGSAVITFSNIPQDAVDLVLLLATRGTATDGNNIVMALNGSTAGFTGQEIEAYGSGSGTNSRNSAWGGYANGTQNYATFGNTEIYFTNYTSSQEKGHYINSITEASKTLAYIYHAHRNWSGTAAITSITLSGFTFAQYSSATLYKITAD